MLSDPWNRGYLACRRRRTSRVRMRSYPSQVAEYSLHAEKRFAAAVFKVFVSSVYGRRKMPWGRSSPVLAPLIVRRGATLPLAPGPYTVMLWAAKLDT